MEELRDIRGLEAISWWPPSPIWLIIIGIIILIAAIAAFIRNRKLNYQASWQAKAIKELERLENNLDQPQIIAEIFELLKEVAIMKFGRNKCASLTGKEWLQWLKENNQNQFDWEKHGEELVQIQYAPEEVIKKTLVKPEVKNNLEQITQEILKLIKNKK